MPQRLPRFYLHQQRADDLEKLTKILLESDAETPPEANGQVLRASADGHHWQRMRGTPIIAKGVSGTMPHTNPLAEVLRKEARQSRR